MDYAPSSVMGLYQRGLIEGGRPGFLTRFAYRPSLVSGEFDGTSIDVQFFDPLSASFALGGRIRLSKKVSITLEGELGAALLSILSIDGYNSTQARLLEPGEEDEFFANADSGSNDSAIGLASLSVGPAASLELGLSPGLGVYLRPSLGWLVGIPFLQSGTSTSTTSDPDGFLHEEGYTGSSISVQVGLIGFGLSRHFDVGIGWRSTTYSISEFPELDASGFFLSLGTSG